ncbi:putative glycolipid-binding domain-containing protein [Thalassococcus sp. S3]|uniref:putative glycolipid-binding domain-containing protein n=1 Tax=Thalassococcus sp. S3 TaxID=2017482 RepID=UPI0013EEBDCF|nr:putative glycolipid-binding domain-containing protein [Thalassococcus sp. S3]
MRDDIVLWRRLDVPGHDACRISKSETGWSLSGTALFLEGRDVARLDYRVQCDALWRSLSAQVRGWAGDRDIQIQLARIEDQWSLNGTWLSGLDGVEDIDLGFTPATNTSAIRRMQLGLGARADTVAAWLDTSDWHIKPLAQGYTRLSDHLYRYRSPEHDYESDLQINEAGLVTSYPELWKMERTG